MDGWMRMGRDSRAVSRVLIHSYARGGMWARCREVARAARPTVRDVERRRPLQRRPANARGCGVRGHTRHVFDFGYIHIS